MVWIQEESYFSHAFFFLITHGENVIPFVILNSWHYHRGHLVSILSVKQKENHLLCHFQLCLI